MKRNETMKTLTNIIYPAFALACFALLPAVYAQCPSHCDANANTALGASALSTNTTGLQNTAVGVDALENSNATSNTAMGAGALQLNTTGNVNTAMGLDALFKNQSGFQNTAVGVNAVHDNLSGNNNAAEGFQALLHSTGSNNIALGANAGSNLTTSSNNIEIGNVGVAAESAKIRIGTQGIQNGTFIAGIYNVNEGGTIKPVYINSTGRLGTQPPASARKFKEEIKAMDKTSEGILKLKPVTFRYKNDAERTSQFGLIAEEVVKVNPDLVVRDENGEIYTVRYEAVNAMLLNEFLKEHKTVQEQGATIVRLQKQIETLSAGLQKVSAQLELSKHRTQTVLNNR